MNEWDESARRTTATAARTRRATTWTRSSPGASRAPGVTALDVATGGGHVARRLRELGCVVTTLRRRRRHASPTSCARPRRCRSPTGSFDVVVCRVAAHHFGDPAPGGPRDGARHPPAGRARGHAVRRRARRSRPRSCAIAHARARTTRATSWSRCWRRRGSRCVAEATLREAPRHRRLAVGDGVRGRRGRRGAAAAGARGGAGRLQAWTDVKWVAQAAQASLRPPAAAADAAGDGSAPRC